MIYRLLNAYRFVTEVNAETIALRRETHRRFGFTVE
jgi:hypothetical protein